MNDRLITATALSLAHALCAAQNTAALVDPYDNFMAFESGLFEKVEGQRPLAFTVAGDQIGYVAYNGDLKVRAHGTTTRLERVEGLRPVVTPHYIAYNNAGALKVWDGNALRTVCYTTGSFLAQDSLVAFFDAGRSLLNVFYDGRITLLEDALVNWPVDNWKASANVLAWLTTFDKKFKVFYQGGIYELNDLVQQAEYQVGLDVVAYRDASDQGFKVFHRGNLHEVEPFMPKSYQCGAGLVAYVDQSDELKVFQDGKVYTAMDFSPTSYQVVDSLVIIRDNDRMLVFEDGMTRPVAQFWPDKWQASWSSLIYLDNSNNVVMWKNGKSAVVLRGGPFDRLELYRGLALAARGSRTQVWWNNEVFSY